MPELLEFEVDLGEAATHHLHVELRASISIWPGGTPIELFLPVWTPGSYLVREYAKHLEGLEVTDAGTGASIRWHKTAKNRFRLEPAAGCRRVRASYTVYCHELTVRTSDLTAERAFWNGACVYLWPAGAPQAAARVRVRLPDGWELATSLRRGAGPGVLEARGLDEIVDSPCLAGTPVVVPFEVLGKAHAFVVDGLGPIALPAGLVPDTIRIVEEAAAVFGGALPYPDYRFLTLLADSGRGGLEHASCSTLLAPRTTFWPRKSYEDFMGLVAHELFHVWNGKRMRPAELWELDYERENYTELLWVVEGFTAYYDNLLCLRAGVLSEARYLEILSETITGLQQLPGRLLQPLASSSFDAWIKLYRPDENSRNSSHSYYTSGSLVALCLDLEICRASGGANGLDDALAALYRRSFEQQRGYDEQDVIACLGEAAGSDVGALADELVHGPFDPDLDRFLAPVGLRLTTTPSSRPFAGMRLREGRMQIASVLRDGPAARAGLSPGDELLALEGLRVSPASWQTVLASLHEEGREITVLLSRRGRILERPLTPAPAAPPARRIEEHPEASAGQIELRRGWLRSRRGQG